MGGNRIREDDILCRLPEADGTWMIVEPFANENVEANLNPVGRIYYSASAMICVPASLSQEVGLGLGAQAGEARIREVVTSAGFDRFRRAVKAVLSVPKSALPPRPSRKKKKAAKPT